MTRVSLMIRGLRRAKGPTKRKLPISIEDLKELSDVIDHTQIDQQIIWRAALLGWFFMLRMGERFDTNDANAPPGRHPILVSDIDPLYRGKLTH